MTMTRARLFGPLILTVGLSPTAHTRAAADLPRLRVSDNHRFLVTADGRPFFWLGDTAWELFHRLDREDAERYLRNRAEQRLHRRSRPSRSPSSTACTCRTRTAQRPLRNNDPTQPERGDYSRTSTASWPAANALGLYVGFLPTWGDKWNMQAGRRPGDLHAGERRDLRRVARAGATRTPGIIWILGGDRPVETDAQKDIIRAMARGLREGRRRRAPDHVPSDRRQRIGAVRSTTTTGSTSTCGRTATSPSSPAATTRPRVDYDRTPVKPVLDGEPIYEDHPVAFNAQEARPLDRRRRAAAALLGSVRRRVRPHLRPPLRLAVVGARTRARSTTRCCPGPTRSTSPARRRCSTRARCSSRGRFSRAFPTTT